MKTRGNNASSPIRHYYIRMITDETNIKHYVVNGIVLSSIAIFGLNRFFNLSTRIPLQGRRTWNGISTEHLSFNRGHRLYTSLTYALNHHNWRHLAFNMMLVYTFGKQIAECNQYSTSNLMCLTGLSAVSTAAVEAPFLRRGVPLIGASGIAMGYLGSVAASDSDKKWVMAFPIPGMSMSSLELFQMTIAGQILALMWFGINSNIPLALRGHLAALTTGYAFARFASYGSWNEW